MAKWGSWQASGARGFPVGIGKIGMAGVRTIVVDGVSALVRLVRCCGVAHLQHDRTLFSGGYGRLIDSIQGNGGWRGHKICVGMGSYQCTSTHVRLEIVGA